MVDFEIEVVVIPVMDVDRAKAFSSGIGFREDVGFSGPGGFRVVRLTPPGSTASIIIGSGVTGAAPGSERGVHLVVDDIDAARTELQSRGVEVSEVFHDANVRPAGGHHAAARTDQPRGLPFGGGTRSGAAEAAVARGKHEQELGHEDTDWPSWYAVHRSGRRGARYTHSPNRSPSPHSVTSAVNRWRRHPRQRAPTVIHHAPEPLRDTVRRSLRPKGAWHLSQALRSATNS
ncbi:hypothetical protein ACQEVF_01355 [Nonomuraea polychroma]|uniref:hypothetical protein n=1 Tax=Nonomuraea polychroma TaxID=46176 RepID=UPI003D8AC14B